MSQARAHIRYLPYSPRKLAQVASLIRGKDAETASRQLRFVGKKAARPLLKALNSAVANLNLKIGSRKLGLREIRVSRCIVNQGPALKRIHPGSMGRAFPYKKKMSHLLITVEELTNGTKSTS